MSNRRERGDQQQVVSGNGQTPPARQRTCSSTQGTGAPEIWSTVGWRAHVGDAASREVTSLPAFARGCSGTWRPNG